MGEKTLPDKSVFYFSGTDFGDGKYYNLITFFFNIIPK